VGAVGRGVGHGLGVGKGVGQGVGRGVGHGVGFGLCVGHGVGRGVGHFVGQGVGFGLGVGSGVGHGVGRGVGFFVGHGDGQGVGRRVGFFVGRGEGHGVGTGVGHGVGRGVGHGVGRFVGNLVGRGVGKRVGHGVGHGGEGVGQDVGHGVGHGVGDVVGVGHGVGHGVRSFSAHGAAAFGEADSFDASVDAFTDFVDWSSPVAGSFAAPSAGPRPFPFFEALPAGLSVEVADGSDSSSTVDLSFFFAFCFAHGADPLTEADPFGDVSADAFADSVDVSSDPCAPPSADPPAESDEAPCDSVDPGDFALAFFFGDFLGADEAGSVALDVDAAAVGDEPCACAHPLAPPSQTTVDPGDSTDFALAFSFCVFGGAVAAESVALDVGSTVVDAVVSGLSAVAGFLSSGVSWASSFFGFVVPSSLA